jgi:hypothetical protein
VTGNQKRILKKIGKFTAYTVMTGGAYFLARGAISLLLRKLEAKVETEPKAPREKSEPAVKQSPTEMEESTTPSVTP